MSLRTQQSEVRQSLTDSKNTNHKYISLLKNNTVMDDIYIVILKYGSKHMESGLSYSKLVEYARTTYPEKNYTVHNITLQYIFKQFFQGWDGDPILDPEKVQSKHYYFLKPEAIAYLLNYKMLEESKKAIKYAKCSTWIAAGATIVSVIVALFQHN